mmetsp:Transcript_13500/g.40116  ORF Transcript_13500/g.40116 Transcript_13500/m.40116 type:complete len:205 (+) Transcript_13500:480-1094(+)
MTATTTSAPCPPPSHRPPKADTTAAVPFIAATGSSKITSMVALMLTPTSLFGGSKPTNTGLTLSANVTIAAPCSRPPKYTWSRSRSALEPIMTSHSRVLSFRVPATSIARNESVPLSTILEFRAGSSKTVYWASRIDRQCNWMLRPTWGLNVSRRSKLMLIIQPVSAVPIMVGNLGTGAGSIHWMAGSEQKRCAEQAAHFVALP